MEPVPLLTTPATLATLTTQPLAARSGAASALHKKKHELASLSQETPKQQQPQQKLSVTRT